MSSHEIKGKMKHIFYIYIYAATNVFFRCTMQMYDCSSISHYSPELFHRALLTSNRKKNHKNFQCTFIFPHILINLLNSR